MGLFDQRGKLFGVINILDLFLIVVLLGALLFAGIKFTQGDQINNIGQANKQVITYVLYNSNSHPFVLEKMNIGDTLRVVDTNVALGKIIEMDIDQAKHLVTTADGTMLLSPVPGKERIYITLEAEVNIVGDVATLGSMQLLVGNEFTVKGPKYKLPVLISDLDLGK